MSEVLCDEQTKNYFDALKKKIHEQFDVAQKARNTKYDVCSEVECIPVTDLADRTEKLTGPVGIAKRFHEVLEENDKDRMQTLFQLFKEIVLEEKGWYKEPDMEKRVEQGIKTALVILTEGVVVAPLDGLPYVKLSDNTDGTKYVDIYFAGPIRAAGGSAQVLPLILGDYARVLLDLSVYKPTNDEIERYVEEVSIYQNDIISRQIKLTEEEIRVIVSGCPVCVNGLPTETVEVSAHRNLPRISTNRIRGGMALIVTEGLGLKAQKIMNWAQRLDLDWKFLEKIIKVEKKADKVVGLKQNFKYLTGVAAGRPLIAYPMEWGGFRIRYGRSRNTGCMGKGINPALMYLLDEFIAVGTHVRIERPGKAAQLFPVETVEGPTVLLKDGAVKRIDTAEEALKIRNEIEKILFVGDMLVTAGDFRKSSHPLTPSPFVQEWWALLVKKAMKEGKKTSVDVEPFLKDPFQPIAFYDAVTVSRELSVPLHPDYIWFYKGWNEEETRFVVEQIIQANDEAKGLGLLPFSTETKMKKLLEKAGIPHFLKDNKIYCTEKVSEAFRLFTQNSLPKKNEGEELSALELLSKASGLIIKDKAGTFAGGRMGRPEAASPRTMKGNPHVLFPIGIAGGNIRSINRAAGLNIPKSSAKRAVFLDGKINIEIALFKCPGCQQLMASRFCGKCNTLTKMQYVCANKDCGALNDTTACSQCGGAAKQGGKHEINLQETVKWAGKNLSERLPDPVKGVKGLISDKKIAEPIEKGILRAKHNLHVFRDGTARFELLNAPLTHFYPKEIGLTVEKAKELGYKTDAEGKPLERDDQLVEMFVQDIVVNEKCGDWLLNTTRFVDDLLLKFYKMDPLYNYKNVQDIIGELVIGLAPHTSAGIVARVIGYSKTRLGWGHPYFVMCKRRNIDGDQDSVMLLMDALLNFSYSYLSKSRGGRMDAPLVFTLALNPQEIDDEVYVMETCRQYPLELYEKSQLFSEPAIEEMPIVKQKLGNENQYIGLNFSHQTSQFDFGPTQSSYTRLESMESKLKAQAALQQRLKPVHFKDSLERVISSHLFPDIIGNTRAFSRQTFRCTKCNAKYRRVPLSGKCSNCKGGNIILTIAEGSVKKYLEIAKNLIHTHDLSEYMKQRITLAEREINALFPPEEKTQKNLFEFA
jgi:DNA polymerase II large subunit